MANQERQAKVNRFENYNFEQRDSGGEAPRFHDNDVRSINVLPCSKKGEASVVEIVFFDRGENIERILKLKDCVNLRFSMDFDILSDNTSSPKSSMGQTSNIEIKDCNDCLKGLMKQGAADWNVEYPPDKDTPVSYKLWRLHEFILVKILLHGGTLEVVARDFEINNKAV
jgi:hypothetical protein